MTTILPVGNPYFHSSLHEKPPAKQESSRQGKNGGMVGPKKFIAITTTMKIKMSTKKYLILLIPFQYTFLELRMQLL